MRLPKCIHDNEVGLEETDIVYPFRPFVLNVHLWNVDWVCRNRDLKPFDMMDLVSERLDSCLHLLERHIQANIGYAAEHRLVTI